MSDHVPLLLQASSTIPQLSVFRLNNHWLSNQSFCNLVRSNWFSVGPSRTPSSAGQICLKLKRIRSAARKWSKAQQPIDVTIRNCEIVISCLDLLEERRPLSLLEFHLHLLVRSSLSALVSQRATYWRQRGKIRHCILGDENTSYHHHCATIRMQHNKIRQLLLDDVPVFSHSGKERILFNFYSDLIGSPSPSSLSFDLSSLHLSNSLDSSQAESIVRPFELTEIKLALLGMNSTASPGPDGFNPAFFKHFWELTSPCLLSFASDFHSRIANLNQLNKSYIVLLPKKEVSSRASDFRPISLETTAPQNRLQNVDLPSAASHPFSCTQ